MLMIQILKSQLVELGNIAHLLGKQNLILNADKTNCISWKTAQSQVLAELVIQTDSESIKLINKYKISRSFSR